LLLITIIYTNGCRDICMCHFQKQSCCWYRNVRKWECTVLHMFNLFNTVVSKISRKQKVWVILRCSLALMINVLWFLILFYNSCVLCIICWSMVLGVPSKRKLGTCSLSNVVKCRKIFCDIAWSTVFVGTYLMLLIGPVFC
jgi:hypothetical protein